MTTNKISNANVTTNAPATGAPRKVKTEAKVNVREGMRTADVKANGSAAQKLVADAFQEASWDDKKNGIKYHGTYDKEGAEAMNSYTFALYGNELRAYNNETGCNVKIKASSQDELKKSAYLVRESEDFKGGNIVYNLNTKTATYDGVSGNRVDISDMDSGKLKNCNIKNSSLETIDATYFTGKLNIKNTKDVGMIWDSATRISVNADPNKKPTLNTDSASKVEIKEYE